MFEHCPDNVLKHIENSEMGHLSKIRRKKMNKNQLKSEILEYIKAHAGTSFVEIERVFEDAVCQY